MICPNCTKPDTSIISSKIIKKSRKPSIIRKRHCLCGYEFETVEVEKRNFKKRKIEIRTLWQNFRFSLYIPTRFAHVFGALDLKSFKLSDRIEVIKENRKLKLITYKIKGGKTKIDKFKLPGRKETIDLILIRFNQYWEKRKLYYPDKPIEDKNIKEAVKVEAEEYVKSVINYLGEPKYNRDFIFNMIEGGGVPIKLLKTDDVASDKFWSFWKKIR